MTKNPSKRCKYRDQKHAGNQQSQKEAEKMQDRVQQLKDPCEETPYTKML